MSNELVKKDVNFLLNTKEIKARFESMLGERANSFLSSVLSAVSSNPLLRDCDPMSVISAAAIAASVDLPINPSLGLAHIVPYNGMAQFQLGWKGYVQLAMRSGQYKTINITPVFDGQIKNHNPLTGEMEFDHKAEVLPTARAVGYLLYFKLLNGYEKYFYMTREQCAEHGKRYSRSFSNPKSLWTKDFDSMALKTVTKMGLSKYGILSIEIQTAIEADSADFVGFEPQPEPQTQPEPADTKKKTRLEQAIEATAKPVTDSNPL